MLLQPQIPIKYKFSSRWLSGSQLSFRSFSRESNLDQVYYGPTRKPAEFYSLSRPTMRSAIIPSHILFPSGHLLPLRWLRLPLIIATLGLSCVCIAVGAQALDMYV